MKLKWTFRLSILTPLIMIATIVLVGGGHGTNVPLIFFYPILFIIELNEEDILTWSVMLIQFPVYGLLVDITRNHWMKGIAIALIIIIHAGQAIIALEKRTNETPPMTTA